MKTVEVPHSQVKSKHVCVSLSLTLMSLSADWTLLLNVFVCVWLCLF